MENVNIQSLVSGGILKLHVYIEIVLSCFQPKNGKCKHTKSGQWVGYSNYMCIFKLYYPAFSQRMENVNIQSLDPRKQELLEARFYGSRVSS